MTIIEEWRLGIKLLERFLYTIKFAFICYNVLNKMPVLFPRTTVNKFKKIEVKNENEKCTLENIYHSKRQRLKWTMI